MKRERGRIFWIIPVLVVAVIIGYYFYGWEIGSKMHPEETAYDMETLTMLASRQIDEGKMHGTFYVNGISEEELKTINNYVCSMNGSVGQFSVLEKTKGGMRIRLKYEISDNYYVYRCYTTGEKLPEDRPEAVKLYQTVDEILCAIITPGMSDYEKELAIHDYLVTNCEYGYMEYAKEYAFTSYGALVQRKAVCNGYAEAMALLLSCCGVENAIMTGSAGGELHAWNRVRLDDKWYQVDATWDDPVPDRGSYAGHMYFNVSDDVMDDTHIWEPDGFEPCSDLDKNYFVLNGLVCDYNQFVNVVKYEASRDSGATIEVLLSDYTDAYSYDFLQDIPYLMYYKMSSYPEPYGDYRYLIIYLNQKD